MMEGNGRPDEPEHAGIPPVPRYTRTEQVVWLVYGAVAVLLVAIPLLKGSFSLPNLAAFVLLGGAAAMSFGWLRNGRLRTAEWLPEKEYDAFLKELHDPYEPPPETD
ncbi:MAG: hypothetical protein ACYDC5_09290 [Candidatus Dormibacteria bacterium]